MCGIVGFNWEDKKLLNEMLDVIRHRGPDMSSSFSDGRFSLGHDRLSIIDVSSRGKQPMTNETGSIIISFNGEIYNYKEIKANLKEKHEFRSESDTEVIIHLYEEVGEKFVEYLNGDFAIAIYDKNKKKIFLTRDRFGIKPLYYYSSNGRFMFFSEIKAILKWKEFTPKIKKDSLSDFLVYSFVPDPNTILEDIYKVSPSEIITLDITNLKVKKEKYYSIKRKEFHESFSSARKKFKDEFYSAVERRMIADVPVGAYLSGGLDSSSVVAAMSQLKEGDLKTFSVGFDSDEVQNELAYAEKVASYLGTDHKSLLIKENAMEKLPEIIWHMDEPINNLSAVPLYFLSKEAKKKVTVVLNGNGSDEALIGYRHHKILNFIYNNQNLIKMIPIGVVKKILGKTKYGDYLSQLDNIISKSQDKGELHKAFMHKNFSDEERKKIFNEFKFKNRFSKILSNKNSYINQLQEIDLQNLLSSNLLIVDDKMAMAHSIESRVPFLDHNLVNFANNLPDNYKLRGWTGKYILRKAMEDQLPKEIIWRKKYGFTSPLKKWFNFFSKDINEKLMHSKFFDKKEIEKRFNSLTNPHINQLWQLYTFEKWHEIFVLNRGKCPK